MLLLAQAVMWNGRRTWIVHLLVCVRFKGFCVSNAATGARLSEALGLVQTRTACAVTANQSPAAPVCICCIPHENGAKHGHPACFANPYHEATLEAITRGLKIPRWEENVFFNVLKMCFNISGYISATSFFFRSTYNPKNNMIIKVKCAVWMYSVLICHHCCKTCYFT